MDVRYTGGARMLLLIEIGRGAWTVKVPVLVSDLDLECKLWLKLRLAPMRRGCSTHDAVMPLMPHMTIWARLKLRSAHMRRALTAVPCSGLCRNAHA